LPDVRSAALALVAIVASPVMVEAACVPVWFALASNIASELFAVAPEAMPASFVKSVELIVPATDPDDAPIVSVRLPDKAPPPASGAVVEIVVVVGTRAVESTAFMVMFAEPLNETPLINLAFWRTVALPLLPLTVVWSPELFPLRLLPEMAPEATILDGVIAPNERVIAGVVVAVATVPLIPLAVIIEADVTVPEPPPAGVAQVPSPRQNVVELALVPLANRDTERFPVVRSAALALVAINASPVIVEAACVPV
jgi:hypothetical protein